MITDIKQGSRTGLILGVVIVFLVLVGAIFTLTEIIGNGLHFSLPWTLRLLILLIAMWIGSQAGRVSVGQVESSWSHKLLQAIITGVVAGLVISVMTYLIISFHQKGLNLRTYLYQLSPDNLNLWSQKLPPITAALVHFLLPIIGCLLGVALAFILRKMNLKARFSRQIELRRTLNDRFLLPLTHSLWGKIALYGLLGFLLVLIPLQTNDYWVFTIGTVGIYVLMGLGLNIVVGLAGLLDLGYVVFFAVGSYTMALLTAPTPHNILWNFWLVLPIGIALAAVIGVLLGVPVLRLRGDYLAIVTLGFGEIIRVLLKAESLSGFSNGPRGIPKIGQPSFFGLDLNMGRFFLYMIIIAVILVIFLTIRLQNSKIGRAWIAIREDETVAQAMGINTLTAKLMAFGIGAAFAGLGGALFASRSQFTGPDDFTLMVSINVLAVVIVGGMGSIPGVIAGAFVLKGLPEILRELDAYRILAFGALLVIMMIYRPQGLIPSSRRRLIMRTKDVEDTTELPQPPLEKGGGS